MKMKNPPRVGDVIQYEILEPLNLTVTAAARVLGVIRSVIPVVALLSVAPWGTVSDPAS
jgi:plasmid maintenance system antidote protein VapI